jgi:hypothetical protein
VDRPATSEARLFKTQYSGLGFKFKSFFRSKESLGAEMKKTLSDTESHLNAFVFQRHDFRPVPHSAFHSLEATHMKTILSQINDNEWYKTFTTLDNWEHATLDRLLHPWALGKIQEREVVVLKVLQQNRLSAWMALLSELLRSRPFPNANGRVILAITREKFLDGKPLPSGRYGCGPPPPPPPPPGWVPVPNTVRPPPLQSPSIQTRISE